MRALVITYTIKTDRWEDALSSLRSVVEQISKFPGLESWANTANKETGNGSAIAVFETGETLEESIPAINRIISGLGAYMIATPSLEVGELLAQIHHAD